MKNFLGEESNENFFGGEESNENIFLGWGE